MGATAAALALQERLLAAAVGGTLPALAASAGLL
jgi:hypothetical protein